MAETAFVTLFVFRVTPSQVSAYDYLGDAAVYAGEVMVPRARLPRARPGDCVRLPIG